MTLAHTGEFGLIERVVERLAVPLAGGAGVDTLLGPGDDAAVVRAPDGRVVACTDVLVEGRHFRRDWSTALDVGHRAAAANLADIAAMGARPTGLLVGLCAPKDLPVAWAEDFSLGLAEEAASVGAAVVGGDTVASPVLTIAVTALGDLQNRQPVVRGGARPGDIIAMAGRLGWAAAGYTILSRGFRSPGLLVNAFRRPEVPYSAGILAAELGATAMIDTSDGLIADAGHIARASGVRMDLRRSYFELPTQMADSANALGVDPYEWILTGGEDHALVATFPPDVMLGGAWREIGVVREGEGVTVDGAKWTSSTAGWDHFRTDVV